MTDIDEVIRRTVLLYRDIETYKHFDAFTKAEAKSLVDQGANLDFILVLAGGNVDQAEHVVKLAQEELCKLLE